jgi:hypothetical protein
MLNFPSNNYGHQHRPEAGVFHLIPVPPDFHFTILMAYSKDKFEYFMFWLNLKVRARKIYGMNLTGISYL